MATEVGIVRKAVSSATEDLQVYAEGVRLMKERTHKQKMDPLGWFYQSRMHGKVNDDTEGPEPGDPDDWNRCQHGTWWFLPWHRMYLMQFERIIRVLTREAGWGLPYWDYPDASNVEIPPAFLDGSSPLFNETRRPRVTPRPAPTWPAAGTFLMLGGGAQDQPAHHGELPGQLEANPHNLVHGFVGGDMADYQSPLDPLFWIHHCNIDRLWEAWLTQPGRANPTDERWLKQTFDFPDPEEGRKRRLVGDVATTALAGYSYDDLDAPGLERERMLLDMSPQQPRKDDRLELLGLTAGGGSVDDTVEIKVAARASDRHRALLGILETEEGSPPLYLRLENVGIEGGDASSMWDVYLGERGTHDPFLVGTIAPFGLAGLTSRGGRQTLTFDVTEFGAQLLAADSIEVTFRPAHDEVEAKPFWEAAGLYTTPE